MNIDWQTGLTILAALGSGLIGGVFFAFSNFVMGALGRLPPAMGLAAMQAINITVLNRLFLSVFAGTAAVSAVLAASVLWTGPGPGALFRLLGGLLYPIGTFLVTMIFNVPLNDRLAAAVPLSTDGSGFWTTYLRTWTMWNHVRTAAALAASAAFILSLLGR